MNKTKLFEVRDGTSFIGTYYAKNEKHAIQRAIDGQNQMASTFRKGGFVTLNRDKMRATEINQEGR